jgi:hypothetical protein
MSVCDLDLIFNPMFKSLPRDQSMCTRFVSGKWPVHPDGRITTSHANGGTRDLDPYGPRQALSVLASGECEGQSAALGGQNRRM